jgi:hypothetical protein
MSLPSASAFVDSNPRGEWITLGGVSRKVLISQIRETMFKLGPLTLNPHHPAAPGLINLFQRSSNWGVAGCALSMEVFDEHQITADLVDLTVQNQPLIR